MVGRKVDGMKIDEEKLKKNLRNFLMGSCSSLTFRQNGNDVIVKEIKIEAPIDLKEGVYGDGFNYSVKGFGNICVSLSNGDTLTKIMAFSLTILSDDDSIKAVQDNKVEIWDKF